MEQVLKLRRFLEPRPKPRGRPEERCGFCAEGIAGQHSHVVNLENRSLLCVCRACYLLFTHPGAAGGKYRAVPDRYLYIPEMVLTSAQWDQLQIPVGMAFFFHNSSLNRTLAFYPSPAGAAESLLPLETWDVIAGAHPVLRTLVPDVEALLVCRLQQRQDCYIVPIDACYELVGRIRRHWKGFEGGEEVRREIEGFFSGLRERSEAASPAAGSAEWLT
jgi:hypothetical protein